MLLGWKSTEYTINTIEFRWCEYIACSISYYMYNIDGGGNVRMDLNGMPFYILIHVCHKRNIITIEILDFAFSGIIINNCLTKHVSTL